MPLFLKKPPIYIAAGLAVAQALTGIVGDMILGTVLIGLVAYGANK